MRKNGFVVMGHLLKLVTPLAHIMAFTITMGTLGFLAAIFIMVLGAMGLVNLLNFDTHLSFSGILTALIVLAVARGALRYLEQMSGHYIAFKLLALLRDKVFSSLRRLAFVKLQDKQAGQLVSLVTNDIELLEVFYAHTIAPIMIAFFTSAILLLVFGHLSGWFVLVALAAYLTVGVILPIITTKLAREDGRRYRELVGEMNDFFLDSVRGMKEIQLFGYAKQRLDEIQQRSQKIDTAFERIKDQEAKVRVYTEVAVSAFNIIMLFTGLILFSLDKIDFSAFLIGVILLMSSYGPVIALSNLSSNLLQTLASGERVLSLLAEEPELKDVESAVDLMPVSCWPAPTRIPTSRMRTNQPRTPALSLPAAVFWEVAASACRVRSISAISASARSVERMRFITSSACSRLPTRSSQRGDSGTRSMPTNRPMAGRVQMANIQRHTPSCSPHTLPMRAFTMNAAS